MNTALISKHDRSAHTTTRAPRDATVRVSTLITTLMAGLIESFDLSEREQDVLQLVLLGRDCATIAQRLGLSPVVAQWHLHAVFAMTGAESREQLVNLALRLGSEGPRCVA